VTIHFYYNNHSLIFYNNMLGKRSRKEAVQEVQEVQSPSQQAQQAQPQCICNRPCLDSDAEVTPMMGCESCDVWVHLQCVDIQLEHTSQFALYICPFCEVSSGEKSLLNNWENISWSHSPEVLQTAQQLLTARGSAGACSAVKSATQLNAKRSKLALNIVQAKLSSLEKTNKEIGERVCKLDKLAQDHETLARDHGTLAREHKTLIREKRVMEERYNRFCVFQKTKHQEKVVECEALQQKLDHQRLLFEQTIDNLTRSFNADRDAANSQITTLQQKVQEAEEFKNKLRTFL
jgi:hypothetical protein